MCLLFTEHIWPRMHSSPTHHFHRLFPPSSDANEHNLVDSAYNALSMLMQQAARDCVPCINQLMPALLDRLRQTILVSGQLAAQSASSGVPINTEVLAKHTHVQELICGVLQHMIRKMSETDVLAQADNIMILILEVLKNQTASVHEESLMAVSALANKVGAHFTKYMQAFQPYLLQGLRAFNEAHVCIGAVGVTTDLFGTLEEQMLPLCNDIVQALLTNLQVRLWVSG